MEKEKSYGENIVRTKKALVNLFFNMSLQFVNVFANMILPPLLISNYGSAVNGLVMSIKELLRYLQVIGGGIAEASIQALYKPLAKKENKKVNEVLSATKKMFFQAGLVFSLLLVLFSLIYPLLINDDVNFISTFLLIIVMGISGASEFFVLGKYRALLIANQKSYVVAIAQMTGVILNVLVAVLLIFMKESIVVVQMGATIAYIARIYIVTMYTKKHYKYINFTEKPKMIVLEKRNDALIHTLASVVVFNSPIIIISIFSGLVEASIYSIYSIIFSGIFLITNSFSSGLVASFGEIIAKTENKAFSASFELYENVYYIIVTIMYSAAAILILPFVKLYTSGATDAEYVDPFIAVLFVILGVLRSSRIPHLTIVNAAGHFKETKNHAIIEAIISLILQIGLIQFYGIYGVLIGCIGSFLYRALMLIIYSNKKIIKRKISKTFSRLLRNIILGYFIILLYTKCVIVDIVTFDQLILQTMVISSSITIIVIIANYLFEPKLAKSLFYRLKKIVK